MLSLIAAISENRVIGRAGALPWRLPDDLRWFKGKTTGHHIIMGRKTFQTAGHPLPRRTSIVITRDHSHRPAGAIIVHSLDEALAKIDPSDPEPFIIGGGEIYRLSLPRVDRMYLTIIHATVEGDTFFPEFDENEWNVVFEERHEPDGRHEHAFTFRILEREDR